MTSSHFHILLTQQIVTLPGTVQYNMATKDNSALFLFVWYMHIRKSSWYGKIVAWGKASLRTLKVRLQMNWKVFTMRCWAEAGPRRFWARFLPAGAPPAGAFLPAYHTQLVKGLTYLVSTVTLENPYPADTCVWGTHKHSFYSSYLSETRIWHSLNFLLENWIHNLYSDKHTFQLCKLW